MGRGVAGGLVYSFGELLWREQSVPASAPLLEASLLGTSVVRVAAGGFHCGALSEHGSVYAWGENTAGQCGLAEGGTSASITGQFQTQPPCSCSCCSSFFSSSSSGSDVSLEYPCSIFSATIHLLHMWLKIPKVFAMFANLLTLYL